MEPLQHIEQRLTDLEVKASFNEDMLDSLNQVIVRQQEQIDLLLHALREMQQRLPEDAPGTARSLRDELPPHY